VYRATHLLLRRPVAIKLLRSKLARRADLGELLFDEARFVARIYHPNVVQVFDITQTDGLTYIVMEFIDGQPLRQMIRALGPLPERTVLSMAIDVIHGLSAGLEKGVIHRDIKPENVLISRSGVAKIVDLGLARSTSASVGPSTTRRAPVVGTHGYIAPEQAFSPETVDFRADMYSLGATLYHALTGVAPFPSADPERCLQLQIEASFTPPEAIVPGISPGVRRLVRMMLDGVPSNRPASYDILEKWIRRLYEESPDPPSSSV
jgi:serine/threonine protein kinase